MSVAFTGTFNWYGFTEFSTGDVPHYQGVVVRSDNVGEVLGLPPDTWVPYDETEGNQVVRVRAYSTVTNLVPNQTEAEWWDDGVITATSIAYLRPVEAWGDWLWAISDRPVKSLLNTATGDETPNIRFPYTEIRFISVTITGGSATFTLSVQAMNAWEAGDGEHGGLLVLAEQVLPGDERTPAAPDYADVWHPEHLFGWSPDTFAYTAELLGIADAGPDEDPITTELTFTLAEGTWRIGFPIDPARMRPFDYDNPGDSHDFPATIPTGSDVGLLRSAPMSWDATTYTHGDTEHFYYQHDYDIMPRAPGERVSHMHETSFSEHGQGEQYVRWVFSLAATQGGAGVRNLHVEVCGDGPCPPFVVAEQDAELVTLAERLGSGWRDAS